jgi:hypothetical protein
VPALARARGAVDAAHPFLAAFDFADAHVDRAVDAAAVGAFVAVVGAGLRIRLLVAVAVAPVLRRPGDGRDRAEDDHPSDHVARIDVVTITAPATVPLGVERVAVMRLNSGRTGQVHGGGGCREHGKSRGDGSRGNKLVGGKGHVRRPCTEARPIACPPEMRLGGPGLRQPEPPGLRHPMAVRARGCRCSRGRRPGRSGRRR